MTIEELKLLNQQLFIDNIAEQIQPADIRFFLDEVLTALQAGITPEKENAGIAAQLVASLIGGAGNDANTLYKLRLLITALQTSDAGQNTQLSNLNNGLANKENLGVAAGLISNLKGGVSANRDTLKKLSDAIDGLISVERNVTDIAARNALPDKKDQENVYVANATADPSVLSGWAIYKYILATTSWIKIAEGESIDIDFSLYATKDTGESEMDYTPAESNNATGFFAGLLTGGKLKLKAALDKIVAVIKTKADLVDGKVPASQLPAPAAITVAGIPAYDASNQTRYFPGDQVTKDARFWSARVDILPNTPNSAPPADPSVIQTAYWTEMSPTHLQNTDTALRRASNGLPLTADGIVTSISVLDNDQKTLKIYKSTNFNGF